MLPSLRVIYVGNKIAVIRKHLGTGLLFKSPIRQGFQKS